MRFLLPLILLFVLCTGISGQIWTGNVNSDWNTPANWSGGILPGNNADITIDPQNYTGNRAHPQILTNSLFSPVQMSVTGGAQFQISANLTTSERIIIGDPGTVVNMNSGIFNAGVAGGEKLIISDDAVFNFTGGQINVGRDLSNCTGTSNPQQQVTRCVTATQGRPPG